MNKYRKEYCKENGSVKINPENTKLYDYIKHLENKLEQAEQLTLTDVSTRELPPWVRPLITIITMSLVTVYVIYKTFYVC